MAKKGHIAWNKGLTKETSSSVALYGRRHSENITAGKVKASFLGKKHTEEYKIKRSLELIGHKVSNETRKKISAKHKGKKLHPNHPWNQDRSGPANSIFGKKHKPETVEKMKKKRIEFMSNIRNREHLSNINSGSKSCWYGKKHTEEYKQSMSEKAKLRWANKEFKERTISSIAKSFKGKINKTEKLLEQLLEEIAPGEYKFTGNGSIVIGGKLPDFTNINGQKKIIELYGDYWHRNDDPQERIDHFKQYGWNCIIVWERELKEINNLKDKLLNFQNK